MAVRIPIDIRGWLSASRSTIGALLLCQQQISQSWCLVCVVACWWKRQLSCSICALLLFACKCAMMNVHATKLQHDVDVVVSRFPLGMTEQGMQYIDLFNNNGCMNFANPQIKMQDMQVHSFRLFFVCYNKTSGTTIGYKCCCAFWVSAIAYAFNIIICWFLTWNDKLIVSTPPRTQGKSKTIQTPKTP